MKTLEKNQEYVVQIEGYNSEAQGVCRIGGFAVFVPNVLEGEIWRIRIVKVSSSAVYARPIELITASESRIVPSCPFYAQCGGCDTMHMSYAEELRFKLNKVNDALHRIGKQQFTVDEIIGSDNILRYRNKGIFSVSEGKFGFYKERSHDLISIDDCLIQQQLAVRCAEVIAGLNDPHIRKVFVRDRVCTVVSTKGFKGISKLLEAVPELTGIVLCVNKGRENSILDGNFYTLYGEADQCEKLCGFEFIISPQSFFQINPKQAEKLYSRAIEYAGCARNALELYCGAGTISMCLSRTCNHITACEIVPEAIENAKQNAQRNSVDNIEFICADAADISVDADLIVVDPPRKGMSDSTIESILRIQPDRIVYVSCNPSTLARDILKLDGYTLCKGTAVDMFPRTCHVETVVLMSRVSK